MPAIKELNQILITAVSLFQTDDHMKGLPGFHSFPNNCCERAAALLAVALVRKYQESNVVLIKGRSIPKDEMHFWVEIDDFFVDPTAHQFDGIHAPLAGLRPNPLERTFTRDEVHQDVERTTDLPYNSNGRWQLALQALCGALDA